MSDESRDGLTGGRYHDSGGRTTKDTETEQIAMTSTVESLLRDRGNGYETILDLRGEELVAEVVNARASDGPIVRVTPDPLDRDGFPETTATIDGNQLHVHGVTIEETEDGEEIGRWRESVGAVTIREGA